MKKNFLFKKHKYLYKYIYIYILNIKYDERKNEIIFIKCIKFFILINIKLY